MRRTLLCVAILGSLFGRQFSAENEDISDFDICTLKCKNTSKTMCEVKLKADCSPFKLYAISNTPRYSHFLRTLIEGHNGLRNRVAEKMQVSNMLELTWDDNLAKMAQSHLKTCTPFKHHPCIYEGKLLKEEDAVSEAFKQNKKLPQISQNSYCERSNFFPSTFLERMLRDWYFEKESMKVPKTQKLGSGDSRGRLLGENNFTHFIYPWSHRFGCAIAKFKGAYYVVCNYFPFYRTITNVLSFNQGKPMSACPPNFPLNDYKFKSLCTQDVEPFVINTIDAVHQSRLIIFICLIMLFSYNLQKTVNC